MEKSISVIYAPDLMPIRRIYWLILTGNIEARKLSNVKYAMLLICTKEPSQDIPKSCTEMTNMKPNLFNICRYHFEI